MMNEKSIKSKEMGEGIKLLCHRHGCHDNSLREIECDDNRLGIIALLVIVRNRDGKYGNND